MEFIEVYGKTIEEAVESGLSQLGVTREQVEIEILEEPTTKGLIFKKVTQAKVKLTKKLGDAQRAAQFLEGLFDLINVHATTEIVRDDDKICINRSTGNVFLGSSDAVEIVIHTTTGDVDGVLLTEKVFVVSTKAGIVDVPESMSGGRCEVHTTTGDIGFTIYTPQ
jgi:DUF4097 and DUF4098 domain-containing protein YvlB